MKRRQKRPEGLVEVSQLLDGALAKLGAKGEWDRRRMEGKCREWLGGASQALARVEERKGIVTFYFDHAAFLQEFVYLRQEGLEMLRREFPRLKVRDLRAALSGWKQKRTQDPDG